jgi:two-component system, OmpR family, KDP operon response regulator KdpE
VTRVLVVDDERQIRRALVLNLGARGYDVFEAETGEKALMTAASEHPDAVLLDLGLPGLDGLQVIEALRGWTRMPIIVLTVREDEQSKVHALDLGADDYVTKPFGMAELMARLRAALRRVPDAVDDVSLVTTSAFQLDLAARQATRADGSEVHLTPIEWRIVIHLTRSPGRLVTRTQLVEAVWGPGYAAYPNLLRVHIAHIRGKLEADPARPRHFVTESGMGHRFEP